MTRIDSSRQTGRSPDAEGAAMRHVLTMQDLAAREIERIFSISEDLKAKHTDGIREALLPGRVLALLFQKPSLRTRVSFEAGMAHLGGSSLFLGQDVGWGKRESVADFAQVLSEYVDAVVCRTHQHRQVEDLAQHCSCPVINGLTERAHPCQALADLFTVREIHGELAGLRIAFVGDANNVARSLAVGCAKLDVDFAIASPADYRFPSDFIQALQNDHPQWSFHETDDPVAAVQKAAAVYTDVWASMGQEAEHAKRSRDFADFQVNQKLMDEAPADACFLHCLPARRGEEVSDEVIDGRQSAVVQQAGNRMHVQKGLLAWLLGSQS